MTFYSVRSRLCNTAVTPDYVVFITVADRTSKLEFMEHSGALTYRRCVTIVVHNYSCNWCNGVHRRPRARLRNRINYLRVNYTTRLCRMRWWRPQNFFFFPLTFGDDNFWLSHRHIYRTWCTIWKILRENEIRVWAKVKLEENTLLRMDV